MLLIFFIFSVVQAGIPPVKDNKCTSLLTQILNKFNDFTLFLHLDASSDLNGDFGKNQSRFVINYDSNGTKVFTKFKFIHIIDSDKYKNYYEIIKKVNEIDIVIFIERNSSIPEKLFDKFLHADLLLIIKLNTCTLYKCIIIDNKCLLKLKKPNLLRILERNRIHLIKKIVAAYASMPPHIFKLNNKIQGVEVSLLESISKVLNFNYEFVSMAYVGKNKSRVEPMLEGILSGRYSIGMGAIVQNEERSKAFAINKYFFIDGYSAIFNGNIKVSLSKLVLSNLIYHVSILFCGVCILGVVYWHSRLFGLKLLNVYFKLVFLPLYEQPQQHKKVTKTFSRMLLMLWWLMSYILILSYKTYLFSRTWVPPPVVKSLKDLIDNEFKFQGLYGDYIYIVKECERTPSSFCSKFISRFTSIDNICLGFDDMFRNKIAIIGEKSSLNYLFYECNIENEYKKEVRFANDYIFGTQRHFWPMTKNSILIKPFRKVIGLLKQSGILKKIDRDWLHGDIDSRKDTSMKSKVVSICIKQYLEPFYILVIGLTISCLVFCAERFYKNKNRG